MHSFGGMNILSQPVPSCIAQSAPLFYVSMLQRKVMFVTKNSYLQYDASKQTFPYRIQGQQKFFLVESAVYFSFCALFGAAVANYRSAIWIWMCKGKNFHLGLISKGSQCLKHQQNPRRNLLTDFFCSNEQCTKTKFKKIGRDIFHDTLFCSMVRTTNYKS